MPKQRLANAALLRPDKIRPKAGEAAAPSAEPVNKAAPPLPPRGVEVTEPTVTVDAVTDSSDTASILSSQTLVEKPDEDPSYVVVAHDASDQNGVVAMDVDTGDANVDASAQKPEPISSKLTVEELAVELNKSDVSGSDQMDVDEVMGNAIDHLRAAFQITSTESTPQDPIEEGFFSTFLDKRKNVGDGEWTSSSRGDRWVTAYPAKSGKRSLYEALSASFDLEQVSPGLLSYTTIKRAAPNFHICIQRADGVSKNMNVIEIPATLYLDRYMDVPDDSAVARDRRISWNIQARLAEIESGNSIATAEDGTNLQNKEAVVKTETVPPITDEELDGFVLLGDVQPDLPADDVAEWSVVNDAALRDLMDAHPNITVESPTRANGVAKVGTTAENPTTLSQETRSHEFWLAFKAKESEEKKSLELRRAELFSDAKNEAYLLHAVICHLGGSAAAGHYWVWIYDFERAKWYKYNDTRVSEHSSEDVFSELNNRGEPYYLAYVRASEVDQLVSIPRREHANLEPNHDFIVEN
jgi:ubiquitin carboxyl-terminal hydrolase 25/28